MMSGAKAGAAVATAPTAGSKRGVGTIAEVAAAARAAASEPAPPHAVPAITPSGQDHQQQADECADGDVLTADTPNLVDAAHQIEDADPALSRRSRAGAGLLKESVDGPDNAAVHLILAGRAYAYGRSIVEVDPDAKKPGETLAIES